MNVVNIGRCSQRIDGKKGTTLSTLEGIFLQGIRFQRRGVLKNFWKLQVIGWNAVWSSFKRRKFQNREGLLVPIAITFSPVGSAVQWEFVLENAERELFRKRILELRRSKPIVIVHLPDDEYGPDGKCMAVANGCIHINAQGYVEPCPFTHFASDNIREKGLDEVFRSQFLAQIRSSDAIFRHERIGCALLENIAILKEIAANTGAVPTDCPVDALPITSHTLRN